MRRFSIILFSTFFSLNTWSQMPALSNHETVVRRPYDFMKVKEKAHPDTQVVLNNVFIGKVPVKWVNNSIGKKKMTVAMMGADIMYLTQAGDWEAYASFTPDQSLLQKYLAAKSKFTIVEKLYIKVGNEAFQSCPAASKTGEITSMSVEGEKVYVEAKMPGISVKKFRVTYINDSIMLICADDEDLTTFIIQLN